MSGSFKILLLVSIPASQFLCLNAQISQPTNTLTIKATIKSCIDDFIVLSGEEDYSDTMWSEGKGIYYIKSSKLKKPTEVILIASNIQIQNLFLAPGYNLSITIDPNNIGPGKIKKIEGIGSLSNSYNIVLDSLVKANNNHFNSGIKRRTFLINRLAELRDSVANSILSGNDTLDKFLGYFYNKVIIDNIFLKLSGLLSFKRSFNLTETQLIQLLHSNFDSSFFKNISCEKCLVSKYYRDVIAGDYLDCLINLDFLKDSLLKQREDYRLNKIINIYNGKVKDYALSEAIRRKYFWSKDLQELLKYENLFQSYIPKIENDSLRKNLEILYTEKLDYLTNYQKGKIAPEFKLQDQTGKTHRLRDFRGKILYMDFWASWCYPCRKETPYLQDIYNQFKDEPRIAFISIAVSDHKINWNTAIKEDNPGWLQLIDLDGLANIAYSSNEIPKFVLIDKKGRIVTFNAPPPSEKENLLKLINNELNK